jgi:Transposase DDE domain
MTYLLGLVQDSRYFSVHGLSQKTSIKNKEQLYKLLQMRINWEKILYTFARPFLQFGKWYLIIDASPLEQPFSRFRIAKHGHISIEGKKNVPQNQIISLILSNGTIQLVLDYKIWVSPKVAKPSDYKKITVLAMELIKRYQFLKLPVREILFDNYFACKKIIDWLNENKYIWTTRLKGNRTVYIDGQPYKLDNLSLQTGESITAELKGIEGNVRILRVLYQDEGVYVATNNINQDNDSLKRTYCTRWAIEVYHREAKQQLGLEYLWMRNYRALYNHVGFVCLAYSLLSALRPSARVTIGDIKRRIQDELYSTHDGIDRFIHFKVA